MFVAIVQLVLELCNAVDIAGTTCSQLHRRGWCVLTRSHWHATCTVSL